MKRQVMKSAWEIARNAAEEFGGKAVEYIAGALKQAWAFVKGNQRIKIEVSEGSRKHKSYVAEIVGKHWRFGLDRKFISEQHEDLRVQYAYLENGRSYEVQDAGDREYVKVENGKIIEISKDEALEIGIKNAEKEIEELLKESLELQEEIKGEPVPFSLEDGLKVAEKMIAKSSHSSYIYDLSKAIRNDRLRFA